MRGRNDNHEQLTFMWYQYPPKTARKIIITSACVLPTGGKLVGPKDKHFQLDSMGIWMQGVFMRAL